MTDPNHITPSIDQSREPSSERFTKKQKLFAAIGAGVLGSTGIILGVSAAKGGGEQTVPTPTTNATPTETFEPPSTEPSSEPEITETPDAATEYEQRVESIEVLADPERTAEEYAQTFFCDRIVDQWMNEGANRETYEEWLVRGQEILDNGRAPKLEDWEEFAMQKAEEHSKLFEEALLVNDDTDTQDIKKIKEDLDFKKDNANTIVYYLITVENSKTDNTAFERTCTLDSADMEVSEDGSRTIEFETTTTTNEDELGGVIGNTQGQGHLKMVIVTDENGKDKIRSLEKL